MEWCLIVGEGGLTRGSLEVDGGITPSRVVRVERKYSQPKGIIWEKITKQELEGMPILREFKRILN